MFRSFFHRTSPDGTKYQVDVGIVTSKSRKLQKIDGEDSEITLPVLQFFLIANTA